jgi:hypothetical protein
VLLLFGWKFVVFISVIEARPHPTVRKIAAISVFAVVETALISSPHGYGVNKKDRDAVLVIARLCRCKQQPLA